MRIFQQVTDTSGDGSGGLSNFPSATPGIGTDSSAPPPIAAPQLQNVSLTDMPTNFTPTPAASTTPWYQSAATGISDFLKTPWGQAAGAVTPGIVGQIGARQAQNLGNQVAGQVPAAVQPATALGQGISTQLRGGPQMAGPYGASIAQQTGAAAQLGNVAQEYASGNLTPAQQLALDQATAAAGARSNLAFSMGGAGPASSASIASQQSIKNQEVIAAGTISQQNVQFAQQALTAIQQTYGALTNQVLGAAGLGGQAANAAAQMIMKNNQQLQQQTSQLWQNITKSIIGAFGKTNQPAPVNPQDQTSGSTDQFTAGSTGQQVQSDLQNLPQFNPFGTGTSTSSTSTDGSDTADVS